MASLKLCFHKATDDDATFCVTMSYYLVAFMEMVDSDRSHQGMLRQEVGIWWGIEECYGQNAAAAAKSLQLCPTLCIPTDGSPPGSPVPGILQVRTLEWVAISFSNAWKGKVKVKSLSCIRLFATSWTAACQAPPFMGFSRQEYCSGEPSPSPTDRIPPYKIPINYRVVTLYQRKLADANLTRWSRLISRTAMDQHGMNVFWCLHWEHSHFCGAPSKNESYRHI